MASALTTIVAFAAATILLLELELDLGIVGNGKESFGWLELNQVSVQPPLAMRRETRHRNDISSEEWCSLRCNGGKMEVDGVI